MSLSTNKLFNLFDSIVYLEPFLLFIFFNHYPDNNTLIQTNKQNPEKIRLKATSVLSFSRKPLLITLYILFSTYLFQLNFCLPCCHMYVSWVLGGTLPHPDCHRL